jgi:hypothetical protein
MNPFICRPSLALSFLFIGTIVPSIAQESSIANSRYLQAAPGITAVRFLVQNWTDEEAMKFYNLSQGSNLVPYEWFTKLEQAGSERLFCEPEHIWRLGYLPRRSDSVGNPDGLPVGFVKADKYLGLSCAACHTGQVVFGTTAWIIDGGPTPGDGEMLLRGLEASLKATQSDPDKFDRFARAVLGGGDDQAARTTLKAELQRIGELRSAYNARNMPHSGEPRFGPGRIDAFGAILNEVAVRFAQVPTNAAPANAPVSYPFLWDTPQHDKVQWNGGVENTTGGALISGLLGTKHVGALGRNVGEVIGVFADVNTAEAPGLLRGGYPSSVNLPGLIKLEDLVRTLWSPEWPTELGPIDEILKTQGRALYLQNCVQCHWDIARKDPNRVVKAQMRSVGTDESMARNATRNATSGVFNGRKNLRPLFGKVGPENPLIEQLSHLGQWIIYSGIGQELPETEEIPMNYSFNLAFQLPDGQVAGSFRELKLDGHGRVLKAVTRGGAQTSLVITPAIRRVGSDNKSVFFSGGAGSMELSPSLAEKLDKSANFEQLKGSFRKQLSGRLSMNRTQSVDGPASNAPKIGLGEYDDVEFEVDGLFSRALPYSYLYKARPLNGVWATAPYLHNGSVPNLEELLKPAGERAKKFMVGSREFDPINVGFRSDDGVMEFDTTASPGNSNAGHDATTGAYLRDFTPKERRQLIEYLKTL